jgi:hypothetical protein
LAARAGLGIARRFVRGYEDAPPLTRVTAFLLVVAGAIHLALVPGHVAHPLAWLFALNGVAFLGVGIAAFVAGRWRPWAAALLVATLAAYLFSLGAGLEVADLVGIAAYVTELVALGMIWIVHEVAPRQGGPEPEIGEIARIVRGGQTMDAVPISRQPGAADPANANR